MQRDRLLVQAEHRLLGIVWLFIRLQHVLHLGDIVLIEIGHHPTFFSRHGLRSWLSKRMRMVSLPTRGTSLRFTASSATSRTVQRARPSGGLLQTMAISRCFWLSPSTSAAPGRCFSYSALSKPPN